MVGRGRLELPTNGLRARWKSCCNQLIGLDSVRLCPGKALPEKPLKSILLASFSALVGELFPAPFGLEQRALLGGNPRLFLALQPCARFAIDVGERDRPTRSTGYTFVPTAGVLPPVHTGASRASFAIREVRRARLEIDERIFLAITQLAVQRNSIRPLMKDGLLAANKVRGFASFCL
jgi:hypothetical protein